jgi:hypothetical protein
MEREMPSTDRGGTERTSGAELEPLAVTVGKACELSGFGPTSIWAFLKSGRLEAVRVTGVRRTLVSFASLARLLSPSTDAAQPQRRGRPRKAETSDVTRRLDELTGRTG